MQIYWKTGLKGLNSPSQYVSMISVVPPQFPHCAAVFSCWLTVCTVRPCRWFWRCRTTRPSPATWTTPWTPWGCGPPGPPTTSTWGTVSLSIFFTLKNTLLQKLSFFSLSTEQVGKRDGNSCNTGTLQNGVCDAKLSFFFFFFFFGKAQSSTII